VKQNLGTIFPTQNWGKILKKFVSRQFSSKIGDRDRRKRLYFRKQMFFFLTYFLHGTEQKLVKKSPAFY
jgi:hypothetical protein